MIFRRGMASALLLAAAIFAAAAPDAVVLRGGERIELQKPLARQGRLVLLTRSDGTLLSIPASDIDWAATAAARNTPAPSRTGPAMSAPAETPAQAARSARGPKARVKLTDADVAHVAEEEAPSEEKKKSDEQRVGGARLEVVDYTQEKAGGNLVVRGSIRNSGATSALNARMTVTAMDEKSEKIASGEAAVSNSLVESGAVVSFSVTIPIGEKAAASIRFAPQWIVSPPPAPAAAPTPAVPSPAGAKTAPAANPSPAPTPYGQGTLYAPAAPAASTTPPADGKTGYIPGMSSPENQPKPPQ